MIAPAFVLPQMGGDDTQRLWSIYDGDDDGVWTELVAVLSVVFAAFVDVNDPSRGVLLYERPTAPNFAASMFSVADRTTVAVAGSEQAFARVVNAHYGDFTASDNRIWFDWSAGTDANVGLLEHNGSALIGNQGPNSSIGDAASEPVVITEIDGSRALVGIATGNLTDKFLIGIARRSGGTLVSSMDAVSVGSSADVVHRGCVRPLNSTRSLALFIADPSTGSAFDLSAQGIAHASTTPSLDGAASTVDTNTSNSRVWLTRCIDGVGRSSGRFIAAWIDETNRDIQLRILHYDGSTITQGSRLNTGITFHLGAFPSRFFVEDLGGGVAVVAAADKQSASDGFFIVEYNDTSLSDLSLSINGSGVKPYTLDGDAVGDTLSDLYVFAISRNRFGICARNETDGMANVRIFHNGGDG